MAWWAWLLSAWRQRRAIEDAAEQVIEAVSVDTEPAHPLSYADNEHIQRQIDEATSHKVPPVPTVDREAVTPPRGRPLPPLPPSKRSR